MKRFHARLRVAGLDQGSRFHSGRFGARPTVRKADCHKRASGDPRLNFAISTRGGQVGVDLLGLQADSADEPAGVRAQFAAAAQASPQGEPNAGGRYAQSDKRRVADPPEIAWEGCRTPGALRSCDGDHVAVIVDTACCAQARCCG